MWFFVRLHLLPTSFADHNTVDVPGQEGRAGSTWMETSVGSLKGALYLALMLGVRSSWKPDYMGPESSYGQHQATQYCIYNKNQWASQTLFTIEPTLPHFPSGRLRSSPP